ncbi:flagellar hook-length control protein FliK [Sporolactobacillus sp. STSJ-5]|uniref:flagellar hook-length control protein FliK n=1 Tax=Sporolactobacillus sp. STSJ-5 TaxID=2965076 RepID=UPI0021056FDD|nr:flagellar hook-length control protein FliK [Sporolactobacillus sp. STSJ-5]MCQ2008952.1 flagellar hook-length control protein FliK [Sporolactobacillus sp. STSJ-5]
MNANVIDIKAEKSEALSTVKRKKKNSKNAEHSFLSIMHLFQQAGIAEISGKAAQSDSSRAQLEKDKSQSSETASAAKNTQKDNLLLKSVPAKKKSLEQKTAVHGLAKENVTKKFGSIHKNDDLQGVHVTSSTHPSDPTHPSSIKSNVLLIPESADLKQQQVKTNSIGDAQLSKSDQNHANAEQQIVNHSFVTDKQQHSMQGNHQQNVETAALIATKQHSQQQNSQLKDHVKDGKILNGSQHGSLNSQKKESSNENNQISLKKVNANDEQGQADHSRNQSRLEHHRAASGQMSKLELWTAFQSGKSVENEKSVHDQVADHLSEWLGKSSFKLEKNGMQSYTVTLYPEHLGKLVISVSRGEQGLTAQLTAETQKTKELLESGLGQLKHDCAGRGINLAQIDVNRQLYQTSAENASNQGQQHDSSQQHDDSQGENQEQHKQRNHTDMEADQNDHLFLDYMMGGGI